ncbi:phenylalanine--tRNA ligase subunit alpha [Caldiplasma sukawensis]
MEINPVERKILEFLKDKSEVYEEKIEADGISREIVRGALSWLEKKGLIDVKKLDENVYRMSQEGVKYSKDGLPELKLIELIRKNKEISVSEASKILGDIQFKIAAAQLAKLGIRPENGAFKILNHEVYEKILKRQNLLESIMPDTDIQMNDENEELIKRAGLFERKERTRRIVKINQSGINALLENKDDGNITEVTSEIIRNYNPEIHRFVSYDLNMPGETIVRNTSHPLGDFIEKIREIFLQMGFEELKDDYVEITGWNMDALFIPQDHPARDMQDTFYLKGNMRKVEENEIKLFQRAGQIQRKGIGKYSGYGTEWKLERAMEPILRTHTTSSTMRALWKMPDRERAVFSVDRVFRHESVDWKHLAEFHQVEGAVHMKNASIGNLKWLLKKFYKQLGFDQIKLVPSYYPYTEPSLDVVVNVNGKEMEMGGSGLIRPEVCKILGLKYRVIAWGLGLERLAMLYSGLTDIRELYNSDLRWLTNGKFML